MMPAAKHGDPQMGVDIHLCVVPPSPSPVPLPTPHMSIVFDPFDYVPYLGATVTVCGMKRATAGTNATVVHIPPGFPFAPKLPDKDDELFMGSSTVVADGDPMSHISHPVLGCQVAGLISPPRLKKKNKGMMLLPTTFNLAIPATVFVGGPPTISLMGMAFKGLFAALGKFAKSGLFRRMRQRLFGHLNPGFLKCTILRAEPVNILNGEVSVEQEDFNLPGRIPIEWIRTYGSSNGHTGWCGHGWETLLDIRLEVDSENGNVWMLGPRVGPLCFERIPVAKGEEGSELELSDGARLSDHGDEYRVITKDDRIYHFSKRRAVTGSPEAGPWAIGRIADRCGNGLDFEYSAGHPVAINESAGRRLTLTIEHSRLTSVTLQDHLTGTEHTFVRYEYDAAGDLVAVIDALGAPYRFAYDAHHMVRHTDRNGLSFYYEYDKQHVDEWRVNHAWGDGGLYNYHFEYLDQVNERRITDSLGNVSIIKLDERGLPISEINPLGGMTIYEYDDVGRTTAVVDPGGHRSTYQYDGRGNLLKLIRPDGKCIAAEFDDANKAIIVVDPNGALWRQKWDTRGLLVEQMTPMGNVSRYEYNSSGQLVTFTNPRGARTLMGFDEVGNLASLRDALGHYTRFAYDIFGNVKTKFDPLDRQIFYKYDAKSRLTALQLPSGFMIQCGYDAEDNLTHYIDENGAKTQLEYFGQGKIATRIQADGHSVKYHYDLEERLIGVTNQRGETYHLNRDALGRIIEEIDYWGQSRAFSYSACGYIERSIDALGRAITYTTDPLGRILKKSLPSSDESATPEEESFDYDPNGNLVACTGSQIRLERKFDSEGRMVEEKQGKNFIIHNAYDEVGNRTGRKTELKLGEAPIIVHSLRYTYDILDQVIGTTIDDHPPINIERDAAGQIIVEQLGFMLRRDTKYSAGGDLIRQQLRSETKSLVDVTYGYDATGNLIERRDAEFGTDKFSYDPLGRITEHLDPQGKLNHYFNDPAGDRLQLRIVEREEEQAAHVVDKTADCEWSRQGKYNDVFYRFDRTGNLVETHNKCGEVVLSWDADQRLIESCTNGTCTHYCYDPLGRRRSKETNGQRTLFFWDGNVLVGECSAVIDAESLSQRAREYVYYSQTCEPLALIISDLGGMDVFYYQNDTNGCPVRLTDSRGKIKWAASYTGRGGIAKLHINTIDNPIRLQGQYNDVETNLSYNRYRYYDSEIGAFISIDPLGLKAGTNLYQYGWNTFRWIDPLGLNCAAAKKAAGEISDEFKQKFMCKQFAQELEEKLRAQGVHGTRLEMITGTGHIWSDTFGNIGQTGEHVAIRVENTVFDNLHPEGISHAEWIKDLGGETFTSPPHARISETAF